MKISAVLVHPRDQRILWKECDFSDSGYKVVLVYTFHWQYGTHNMYQWYTNGTTGKHTIQKKEYPVFFSNLKIMGSQNWWFGDPITLLYRFKPFYSRVHDS